MQPSFPFQFFMMVCQYVFLSLVQIAPLCSKDFFEAGIELPLDYFFQTKISEKVLIYSS